MLHFTPFWTWTEYDSSVSCNGDVFSNNFLTSLASLSLSNSAYLGPSTKFYSSLLQWFFSCLLKLRLHFCFLPPTWNIARTWLSTVDTHSHHTLETKSWFVLPSPYWPKLIASSLSLGSLDLVTSSRLPALLFSRISFIISFKDSISCLTIANCTLFRCWISIFSFKLSVGYHDEPSTSFDQESSKNLLQMHPQLPHQLHWYQLIELVS